MAAGNQTAGQAASQANSFCYAFVTAQGNGNQIALIDFRMYL
jgi:hypothetical protein